MLKKFVFERIIPFFGSLYTRKNKFINVIYYHDIVNGNGYGSQQTDLELFKNHMNYIKSKNFSTYTFDELENNENLLYSNDTVLITFDDGWVSNYSEIFDFMKDLNIKYNIFLEVGKIGADPNYLTWDMVREMYSSGIVGFGAHTFSHPDMSDLSIIDTEKEFLLANKKITDETGIIPKDFCYPFGKYSEQTNKYILDNTDYTRIYTSKMMYSYKKYNKIVFGRNSINGDRPFSVFINMLKGNYAIFNTIRRK